MQLLADIISQQEKLNSELIKVQQERDEDRFRLIEQLQEGSVLKNSKEKLIFNTIQIFKTAKISKPQNKIFNLNRN